MMHPYIRSACIAMSVFLGVAAAEAQDLQGLSRPAKPAAAPAPSCDAPPKDPSVWDKSLVAGFNYTDGNTKTTNLNLGGLFERDYQDNAWRIQADYSYGSAANSPSDPREEVKNNVRNLVDYRRILDDTWFFGVGNALLHDEIADIRYRDILSPSLGAYLVRNDDMKLSLEMGPSYVWQKLGSATENYLAPRIADRFEWKVSDTSKIFQFTEYLVSADDSANYIVNAELGVEAALNSSMSLVFTIRDNYINEPAEDRVQNDVATITALKVTL